MCRACDSVAVDPAALPIGALLGAGRYQLLDVIGRGGFGITYEAGDTRLQRRVAIKELFPDLATRVGDRVVVPADADEAFAGARERFLREARVLARFTHPGVVRVYEVFEEHGTAYLVMELLGGCTLVDVLRARGEPFTEPEVLDVAGRVAAALRPVHAAGVLHRDLNPSNVMLTEHGRIVLIDFGLARDYDEERTMGMTRVVTPGYAPMEQYRGEARFGPSTDVYGLAATLYRLATGRVPATAIARDAGAELVPVHRANPEISKAVGDAIGDGLELEPAHRPQDLDSLLARLGIRHLPEGPRSVLLGSPGAELDRLRAAPPAPAQSLAPAQPPAPAQPAAPVAPDAAAPPAVDGPDVTAADPDRTEHVDPAELAAARAALAGASAAGRPAPVPEVDATRPAGPERPVAPVGPDATRPATSAPTATALLQGHEAAAPPADVAPGSFGRAGRRKVTLPLAVLAVAAASAAPVLVVALLVLVALPALATIGDLAARRHRLRHDVADGWLEARAPTWAFVVVRSLRNVGVSVVRSSPVVGIGVVILGCWYLLAGTSLPRSITDALLRIVGAGTAAALLAATAQGSNRFRSGFGTDQVVAWLAPDGRTTQRLVVGWIVLVLLVAAALWLDPDPFPLGRP